MLPDKVRAQLARGPDPDPAECRVCEALDEVLYGTHRYSSPAARLMDWHMGYDLYFPDENWRLGRGPECYRRCLLVYVAAGWPGDLAAVTFPC